jgi:hypothetical protein
VYAVTLTVTNDAGSSTIKMKNYITAINPAPTIPPMLAGILANLLRGLSMDANAAGPTPMTDPAGTSMALTIANSLTMGQLNNSIYGLRAYGGTNIGAGIAQAIEEFNSGNYVDGNKKYIVLLTDGYSQYPDYDIQQAQLARSQNITIYTVGIGMPDDNTLQTIADITGGQYRKVSSLPDLVNTFSAIANNMTDVAGYNISLCTFTNYSNTISPDALYVINSTIITEPSGQLVHKEPTIYRNDVTGTYNLLWDGIGNLSYNQNMTINYQLNVTTPGNITPITNESYVGFWTKEGEFTMSNFNGPTLYVNGTSNNTPGMAPPDLTVTIISPSNNTTVTSQRLLIDWNTVYTGTDQYHQMVKCNNVELLPLSPNGYSGYISQPWQYVWDITNMPSGNYTIWVNAYDSYCNRSTYVNITIDHSTGKIHLE